MPFVDAPDDLVLINKLTNLAEAPEDEDPSAIEIASALWRQENTIGSFVNQESGLPDGVDDQSFNPYDYLSEGEKLDKKFVSHAALADTVDEIEAVRKQYARETTDRETIQKGGAMSFLVGLGVVGVADPINLIPIGGAIAKTYKAGNSILDAAVVTGSVATASTAVTEAALHQSQLTRTYGESAINLGAAALLGGVLGAGGKVLANSLDASAIGGIVDSMDVEPKVKIGDDSVLSSEYRATPQEKSVGAAQRVADVEVSGKAAKGLVKALGFDPLSRTLTSDNPFTRIVSNRLAENPIKMDGDIVTAVESRAKIHDGKYAAALQSHLDIYRQYRKNGGRLRRRQFNEEVARAMRNEESAIPEALQSANNWRTELYDPIKDDLVELGLLPEDVSVGTAVGYLNRRWNKGKVSANLPKFIDTTAKWLRDEDVRLRDEATKAEADIAEATGAERTRLQEIIDRAERKEAKDLTDEDYQRIAEQIAQRIQGTPDGRLPYDWKIGEGSANNNLNGTVGLRGPLKSRTFQIPDNMVEEFLDNDIEDLGRYYLRNTATDMEIVREFGDLDLTIQKKEILDWYTEAQRVAKTEKERIKLKKQADADIRDITAMRDRMRGVYAQPDPDNVWVRAGRVSRNLNYMRFMGGVVASSVPDVARIFMAEGIGKTFSKGLLPLARNINSFKVSSAEAKRYGVGVDALMGGRSQIISDVADYTQPNTAFERGIQYATDNFGRVNLMDYWTTGVKQLHAVTMQNSVIDGLLKGQVDKRLARLGIDAGNAQAMAAELKKHATKVDGVWLSNARNWDSPELERLWGAAIRKESDRVIVVPGQEKPLFMSTELGKTIFQFRSFMFASTQRMTIAALQAQDHNALAGVLMLTTLGMMSYSFKQWDAKREIAEDPVELVIEGIDRSGALGGIMEINNTLEKLSSNNFGMRPLLGVDIPAARFASRSMSENLLGPTFGSFLDTSLRVANAGLAEDGWNESDTRALRRLIPYQNLTFIRQAFDRIEEEVGDL
jgi:hypothetical protein